MSSKGNKKTPRTDLFGQHGVCVGGGRARIVNLLTDLFLGSTLCVFELCQSKFGFHNLNIFWTGSGMKNGNVGNIP